MALRLAPFARELKQSEWDSRRTSATAAPNGTARWSCALLPARFESELERYARQRPAISASTRKQRQTDGQMFIQSFERARENE